MLSCEKLPEGYEECLSVNFTEDIPLLKKVTLWNLIIKALMLIIGLLISDLSYFLNNFFPSLLMFLGGSFIYVSLHEAAHGLFMRIFGAKRVDYGFKSGMAYAYTDTYFARLPYIVIALAPVVILGLCLFMLHFFLPFKWFWHIYLIEIFNLSGAAGDYFVVMKFAPLQGEILIRDNGTSMKV